jgi:S1-C subfamily serine protease
MRLFRSTLALLTLTGLPSLGLVPRAAAEDLSPEDLYDKVVRSCVYIITPLKGGFAQGSGSLIDVEQKLVLTNYHVVDEENMVHVQFPVFVKGEILTDKQKYKERVPAGMAIKGTVLYRDKSRDLALVRLDKVPPGVPAIPLAKYSPKVGTTAWQIGNAGAVAQVFRVSKGDISAVAHEKFMVGGGGEPFEVNAIMVTSTAPTNPGDSGGPLFDKRGYQVAVTESGSTRASLVNHFVDITEVRSFLNQKKITIKELSDEPDPPTPPKKGTTLVTPPKKDNSQTLPPAKVDGPGVIAVPKTDDAPAASAADEKAAAEKLRSAKLFRDGDDNRPTYIMKLKEVVAKWPNTAAGKEAKKLLETLK